MWRIVPKSVGESSVRRSSEDIPYAARQIWKSTSRMIAQKRAVEMEDQSAGRLSLMTGDGTRMYLCANVELGRSSRSLEYTSPKCKAIACFKLRERHWKDHEV
ncbi:hypothetical protein K523DRAFT_109053 [Schizophyllum commune Tattone D]|nr:hypothetical protein K523DRAFT_109053 [Schizophyllum commune Tattone D]